MRQERTVQASIFDLFAGHEIGRELRAMSAWLDDHRELASLVAADLRRAKACGVRDMVFHRKGGLGIEDMVRSRWVYRKLRNFRAGIEADISCLKRAYGLARCTWRGLGRFRAYVWSSVVAYNLALLARLQPT